MNLKIILINAFGRIVLLLVLLFSLLEMPAICRTKNTYSIKDTIVSPKFKESKYINVKSYLQVFYPMQNNASHSITICADLPVNNDPACVFKKGEPGHVFIILSKQDALTGKSITRSFGFYPRVPATCIIKQGRSQIIDNSNREYDASIQKILSPEDFELILDKCKEFAKKKYNLKKYNCYDYVVDVFNSIPGIEKLPVTYVKFPFIFGKGGSPCGLYSDLKKLASNGSGWAPYISFGLFKSPASNNNGIPVASF